MTALTTAPTPNTRNDRGRQSQRRPRHAGRSFDRALPLTPAIILMGVFLLGPVISSFYGSLTNASLTGAAAQGADFIGLQNYIDLLSDPDFPKSIMLTIVFLFASAIIGQNVLGLGLAMLMRTGHKVVTSVVGTLGPKTRRMLNWRWRACAGSGPARSRSATLPP